MNINKKHLEDLYQFWFKNISLDQNYINERMGLWFKKDDHTDQYMRDTYSPLLEVTSSVNLEELLKTPKDYLSFIILCDQVPRNSFRNTPKSFEFDQLALKATLFGLDHKIDQSLNTIEKLFFFLPLEHSEEINRQKQSLEKFKELMDNSPENLKGFSTNLYNYAVKHFEIIERFHRFPHRNSIINRPSTNEELEFLTQPGSSF